MTYRDFQTEPGRIPPWAAGRWGTKFYGGLGVLKDGMVTAAMQALRLRWASKTPDEGLPDLGLAADMPKAPGESFASYRHRLGVRWRLAATRGTVEGIPYGLSVIGLPNTEIRDVGYRWGRRPSTLALARPFWVIVRQPHPFGTEYASRWGDGSKWGGGQLWGIGGGVGFLPLLRAMVRLQKPAHATCAEIVIVLSGDIVDGTGTTDDGNPKTPDARVVYLAP